MKRLLLPAILVFVFVLWSCGNDGKEECVFIPEIANKVQIRIEQYQDSLVNISSKQELVRILSRNPVMRDYIFGRSQYPNDSVFVNELYRRFTHPEIDSLLIHTKKVFGDLSDLEGQFSEAFSNLGYYYPDFRIPKIQTVMSLPDEDMVVSDSLIIISLDHFLGKGARYRPNVYEYQLKRYEPEDIVPSCMLLFGIGENINKTDLNDKTVLADMIAYGKSFYFAKQMLPCTPDSVLIWYSKEEMEGARENEDLIWARFIQDKVLFSTGMIEKRNFLGDRPFTIQVGEKCPGRIGQWIGWQIVKAYMKNHPELTLQQLMATADAQKLFKESNYKPRKH
jgi:hypothetical protein